MATSSTEEIDRAIREEVRKSAELKAEVKAFAEEVVEYWKEAAPVKTGRYKASIRISKQTVTGDGLPLISVRAFDKKAAWIEYGVPSSHREQGGSIPAYAPLARTKAHFRNG